ncbi:MAG: PSD1 and planctomycete cytochrome C domain-containing protein, partial [Planctomycetia bacterium]
MVAFRNLSLVAALVVWLGAAPAPAAVDEAKHAAEQFFERKVRPVLLQHCTKCHGPDKQQGGLRLDSLAGLLAGGDAGPALVPGDPAKSTFLEALKYGDDFVQMPPAGKLPQNVIDDLNAWVKLGAPWPGSDAAAAAPPPKQAKEITAEDRAYWAFQPIKRPTPPAVKNRAWGANPVDAFVLAKLEAKGVAPNGLANRRELLRRVYFDLVGLPPTPAAVEAFAADTRPEAFAAVVDDLLDRPQYGERWARHWLDVVRFAQSDGYEFDDEKPFAWRYRDYVVQSLNADKPYDRFLIEQLAGDEIDQPTDESRVATAFYRLGTWDVEPDDARAAEFDDLDDVMVTAGAAFMGLTFGCCRCHDHRFDPLPQEDYYRLLAFFRPIRRYERPDYAGRSAGYVALGDPKKLAERVTAAEAAAKPLREQRDAAKDDGEKRRLDEKIRKTERKGYEGVDWTLAVREGEIRPTNVLIRGGAGNLGPLVEPGFPQVITKETPAIVPPKHGGSSGRRLALANWLVRPDNPLTARVMANRVWKYHFGRGLVRTTADFGKGGTPPSHPQLLDWLASEFMAGGWSLKHLHRVVLASKTYQLSSRTANEAALTADPDNDLLWRQNLRRLEAEAIRDAVLTVSGRL